MSFGIASIVEGQGEVSAVPIIIRRIVAELDWGIRVKAMAPVRVSRYKFIGKEGEIERALELAAARLESSGAILVLLDSEGDCPAKLGPSLHARAQTARPDLAMSIVLAHCEFEAWFLASASSLRGCCELPLDLDGPENPEAVQGAKEWLEDRMPKGRVYSPSRDQPSLATSFDLAAARRAPSFDKFYRELVRILDLARLCPE
jgi:hypothetical protein